MTETHTHGGDLVAPGSITPAAAVRIAWATWMVLLVIPFAVFLGIVFKLGIESSGAIHPRGDTTWFLASILYLLVAVPASFFWRGHLFKVYWSGRAVAPGKYLFGMLSVWLALVVGGIFSLIGCIVDKSLLPDLFPAWVAFMFYVTLYPSGRAMVRRGVGASQDPEVYEAPR